MRKLLLSLVIFTSIVGGLKAQQDPQYTMFYFNKMLYNPAYAGAKDGICGTILGRFQWNGLQGAPNTWLVTADMPFDLTSDSKNQLGIGLTGYGDYIGFQQDHGLKVAACYRRRDVGPGHLAVGIDVGFSNKNIISPTWITPSGLPEAFLTQMTTAGANNSNFGFDFSAGAYYHNTNFYVGASVLHLTASDFTNLNIRQARHMYFTGGYTFPIGQGGWKLNPNAIVRTDFATANFDINLNALYDINGTHGIFFGATYRYIDAIGINVGYNGTFAQGKMGMLFGYNYDINTSRLNSFNSGSHEIILRFCYKIEKDRTIYERYVVRFGDSMRTRY
jgi:type IX secretion system PorP/SprF family membrane protein